MKVNAYSKNVIFAVNNKSTVHFRSMEMKLIDLQWKGLLVLKQL